MSTTIEPRRTHVVAVRLSDDERDAWRAAAAADGRQQLGRWTREQIARVIDAERHPSAADAATVAEVARLRRELTAAGGNLNQLARHLNSGALGKVSQKKVADAMREHQALLAQVRDALHEVAR